MEGGGACSQAVISDNGCKSVQCRREVDGVTLGGCEGGNRLGWDWTLAGEEKF